MLKQLVGLRLDKCPMQCALFALATRRVALYMQSILTLSHNVPFLLPCCACCSYGIQAAPERYSLTGGFSWGPATPVPGLLLTGQDLLGDGVTSAFFAGTLAAQKAGGLWVTLGMFREMLKWM